ncbi:MAG: APC family permease [Alphaproteobacteria bacterium]|nr:MAG: APC family permease [Alphaproteobacteria bacterium]
MQEGHFIRILGRRDVLFVSFGAMIGWSWVMMSGEWISRAGSLGAMLAFAIGGIAIVLISLTYAELASAMPQAGGEHVYSHRALGFNGSFICTWALVLAYLSVTSFEAVALPTVMTYLFPNFSQGYLWTIAGWDVTATWVGMGVLGSIIMSWINIRGIKPAAVFQSIITLFIMAVGVMFFTGAGAVGDIGNMDPLFVGGAVGVMGVLIMVPTMFIGFDIIPQSAEEIDLPFGEIGKVLVVSVVMAVLWYVLIIFGVSLALDGAGRAAADLVTADANAQLFGGNWAGTLLVLGGLAGILSSWNAFVMGASRAIYAMAQSGMLPAFLGHLHPTHNTPRNAILVIGILSCLAPFFGRPVLVWLIDAGSFSVVIAYGMVALSFLVLRHREPDMDRPYRVRHGQMVGWSALILSIAMLYLYVPGSPAGLIWPYEWAIVLAWVALGVVMRLTARPNP